MFKERTIPAGDLNSNLSFAGRIVNSRSMPIYEYFCPDNNRIYQFFAKTIAQGQTTPKCPDNPDFRMVRMMSAFAITGKGASGDSQEAAAPKGPGEAAPPEGGGGADDPRMDAAFDQLEREMGSVDENDPRAMGRMMRRMSELTGEKLDGQMEEVVRKLEEGTDPETLENEMGEMMGGEGGEDDGFGGMGGLGGMGGGLGAPSRDPNLYDY
jgi:predicted nucleic acid-binding Zn ribbon protein